MTRYCPEKTLVVEKIHEYLSTIGENVRSGRMGIDEFIIFKVRLVEGSSIPQDIHILLASG